jgi:lysophospholipase L1-like esterase
MRATFALIGSTVTILALALVGPFGSASGAGATTPVTTYYLALGDSLSTGGGATAGASYVDDIYAAEKSRLPGLELENLGCAGDSTTRMIHGGLCTYAQGDQLGAAEAFLTSHPDSVKFITIDVGGDDVDGCAPSGAINQTCIQNGLQAVKTNMQTILGGIRAAGGSSVPIVGMSYYDPWLAFYLQGASGQQAAWASLDVLYRLNSELRSSFKQYGVRVAAVQKSFDSWDAAPTGSFDGQTLPQDVANICNWTHMCDPTDPTVHTNDTGHSIIAADFEARLQLVH